MKKRSFPDGLLLLLAQALLLTASVLFSLLDRLNLSLPPAFLAAILAAPLLVYSILFPFRRLRFLLYPLSLFAVLAALYFMVPDLRALAADPGTLEDLPAALSPLLKPLAFILSVLLSVTALSVGEISCLPLGIAVALFCALLLPAGSPDGMLLPAFALALSACPPGRLARRAVPAMMVSFLLALLLSHSPVSSFESPALREQAVGLFSGLRDRLFYSDARLPFSLSSLGWEPLGAGRPGGSAFPSDAPILEVRAESPLLLRGAIHSEYDGHVFSDPVPGIRYLLTDPRYRSLRDTLFDRGLPKGALRSALPPEESISVRLLAEGAGTLFVTGRFDSLSGSGLVLYHSGTGEIFATRNLAEGDAYAFRGIPLTGNSPEIQQIAITAESQADGIPDLSAFLAIPESVEPGVYRLASVAIAGADTAAGKAERLTAWLSSSYPYSLRQSFPPEDREFVSWFLLSERRGYCTSFAAALVVLARCVGLPARYCEGFSARPGPDGVAVLTGYDAHAWAEIYLPGLGWTPFDATPASSGEENGDPSVAGNPFPQESHSPDGMNGTEDRPDAGTGSDPGGMSIATSSVPTPNPGTGHDAGSSSGILPRIAYALNLLLILSGFVCATLLFLSSPTHEAKGVPHRRAVGIWYDACRALLTAGGLPPCPGEAPGQYLRRADSFYPGAGLDALADCVNRAFYSRGGVTPKDAADAQRAYLTLRARLPLRKRPCAAFLRVQARFLRRKRRWSLS